MAQFKDFPPELVHEVAKHLAPRRCEDLKHDILSFRSVERRTWLIANQHAFKYMTLYSSDPNDESSLGLFARLSRPDSSGCNIRDMVQEVYVVAARQLGPRVYDENLSESEYRRRAGELFCKMLDKKPTDLTNEEQVAGLNYWKLCIQPFVPQHDIATIQSRLKEDLAKLPHLRSVYADAVEDVLDTKSEAWETLTKLSLEDKIWNKDRRRFHSIDDEADAARDRIGYYTLGDFGMLLVGAIPPSVSRLKWTSCFDWFGVEDYQRPLLEQIIEFNASLSPMSDRYLDEPDKSMISSFPKLQVLQLTSACTNFSVPAIAFLIQYRNYIPIMFPPILQDVTLPLCLRTIKLKDFAFTSSGIAAILKVVAPRKIALHLEGTILVQEDSSLCNDIETEQLALIGADYWRRLLERIYLQCPEYFSSGLIRIVDTFGCIIVLGDEKAPLACDWDGFSNTGCAELLQLLECFARRASAIELECRHAKHLSICFHEVPPETESQY